MQKTLIEHVPDEIFSMLDLPSIDREKSTNEYYLAKFQIFDAPENYLGGTASISSASSTDLVGAVSNSPIDLSPWVVNDIRSIEIFQEKMNRFDVINEKLTRFDSSISEELIVAKKLYLTSKQELTPCVAAGIAMRNVIEHIKGKAFSKVEKSTGKVKWIEMANELCLCPAPSPEYSTLVCLEKSFKILHTDLTNLAKNLPSQNSTGIEVIWVRFIDFLFTFTGLIKI